MSTQTRTDLAKQLLIKLATVRVQVDEIDALKTRLREIGKSAGNFTERFPDLGHVEVKAAKDPAFKGTMPALVPELFLAMSETERHALQETGVVKMTEMWSKPFFGAITAKLL